MKKSVSVILVVLLVISLALPVYATEPQQIMPRYTYVDSIWACITIDSTWGIATCEGEVITKGAYPVEVVVSLQVYKNGRWETIKSWSNEDTYSVYLSKSYAVMSGYQYRAYVEGYVYNSNNAVIESTSLAHSTYYAG